MNTKKMAKRLKDSGVSPVIATILMVAITVVLAAVLYVMVSGFTHSPGTAQSVGMTESQSGNVWTISINSVSASNIALKNLKVVVSGASNPAADGTYTYSSTNPWTIPTSNGIDLNYTATGATYVSAGDSFTLAYSGTAVSPITSGAIASSDLVGATITLYNGNTNLGSVTL